MDRLSIKPMIHVYPTGVFLSTLAKMYSRPMVTPVHSGVMGIILCLVTILGPQKKEHRCREVITSNDKFHVDQESPRSDETVEELVPSSFVSISAQTPGDVFRGLRSPRLRCLGIHMDDFIVQLTPGNTEPAGSILTDTHLSYVRSSSSPWAVGARFLGSSSDDRTSFHAVIWHSMHSCPRQGAFHCILPSGFCLQFDPLKKTGGNISKYNVLSKNSVIFSEWFSILDLHDIQDLKKLSRVRKGLTVHWLHSTSTKPPFCEVTFQLLLEYFSDKKLTTWLPCVPAQSLQSCPTLCNPMNYSPPGSSVYGILQARTLQWVAVPSSRGSSQPRDWTCVSYISCIGQVVLYY